MTKLAITGLNTTHKVFFNIFLTILILNTFTSLSNANILACDINSGDYFSQGMADTSILVVIDPGHGGKDAGTYAGTLKEKDITLSIAKKLKSILESDPYNVEVVLTREGDNFVPLFKRIRMANRLKADIFISIHCNSYPANKNINGVEVYTLGPTDSEENLDIALRENASVLLEGDYENNYDWYDPNSIEAYIFLSAYQNLFMHQSMDIASKITKYVSAENGMRNRGVKQSGFVILKYATMPSVLIEAGFVSNSGDRKMLGNPSGQYAIAKGIAAALKEYLEANSTLSNATALSRVR